MRKEKSMCLLLCCLGTDRAGCYGKLGHRRIMMAALMQSAAA